MPEKILVLNGHSYGSPVDGLGDVTTKSAEFQDAPEEFKLILFTGGEDITPMLYGDTSPRGVCRYSMERDKFEIDIYELARKHDIKMTGICRGIQFLNVMAGGRMMHDITSHAGPNHLIMTPTGYSFMANSYHHQMVLPPSDAKIVGWSASRLSRSYIGNADLKVEYHGKENEVVIYPRIKAFGVQYHPEVMKRDSKGFGYYRDMIINALELPWEEFIKTYTRGKDVNFEDDVKPTMHKHGGTASG
jgi:GMP synthase-like glutamine amidotransferase